jgi:hypothetical protein
MGRRIRWLRAATCAALLLPLAAQAQQAAPTAPPPPSQTAPLTVAPPSPTWVPRAVAELQALDKITARATSLTVRVGQSVTFGSLSIFVRACVSRPPDAVADSAAFLDITDSHPGAPQFHGWMLVSAPSVAMLEHPVYDVRPAACHA